jgi:predicted MFS family arabinose efflux permease
MAQLYLVALVEGTLFVFFGLAESAALPRVVASAQLPAATAQGEVTGGIVTLIGPGLGGALFGVARMLPFLADAIFYGASVLSLAWIRLPFQAERPDTGQNDRPAGRAGLRQLREEIGEGLVWLWREPVVRSLTLLHGVLILAVAGMTLLLVVVAEREHAAPATIGLMIGVGGAGGMLGALLGARAHKHLNLGQIMVGAFWLFALLWPLYAVAPSPLALGAVLAAFWALDELYDVAQLSYRLALIPDALRGRVTGAMRLVFFTCDALGIALTGLLLQRIGVLWTILCFEGVLLLLAVLATRNRALRAAHRLAEL